VLEDQTEILSVERRVVLDMIGREELVASSLVRELAQRTVHLCRRVGELGAGRAEQRIARLLLTLAERSGSPRGEGEIRVAIALSRQDIADLCGTTVETTIRIMSRWTKDGVIAAASHGFIIRDASALRHLLRGAARSL